MMKKLILSVLMMLALAAGSVFAQNANTGNKKASRPRTTKAKGNANAATTGGSTGTAGGTEAGGEKKKGSAKKKHRKHRKHAKKY